MHSGKPQIITQIEKLWGNDFELYPANPFPNLHDGLMAFRANHPKFALDDQGQLVGLNLAATELDDSKWQKIVELLVENSIALQVLNLSDNQLQQFLVPPSVTGLIDFDIEDNPSLISPPPDVVEQGKFEVLKWLKATGKRPVLEAKVMFIGDSNYGKTHLIEMLRHGRITRKDIKTTHGIERERLKDAPSPAGPVRLNVWDLGGQQFMRNTHQFFFTERTLYVLVTIARRERKDLNHWLQLVSKIGADAPVLVVINKIDLDPQDIDREPLQRDFPNIIDFARTAVYDNPEKRVIALDTINELSEKINSIVTNMELMPDVFVEQRQEWFTVKEQLETKTEEFISYEEYQKLPYIKDLSDEEQCVNLKQLARLGTVVSFVDDHRLSDTHVINPRWITDGVYDLINDPIVKDQRRGEFNFDDFERILDKKRYPRNRFPFLVDLMKKFKLCYQVDSNKDVYLYPDLFADIEPKNIWPANDDNMRFRLNYGNDSPNLFITQFIVVRYNDIVDEKRWRSGVVISDGYCEAIVRRSFKDEHIEIEVTGQEKMRRGYLHSILNVFRELHRPFEKMKVLREVPYENLWLNYDDLLIFEEDSREYYHPSLRKNIPVSEVLDGYGRPGMPDSLREINDKVDELLTKQKKHRQENKTDVSRVEKEVNEIRSQLDRLRLDLEGLAKKRIDPEKLETHFEEVKSLIDEALLLPQLKTIPALKTLAEQRNNISIKKKVKIVGQVLPSVVQAVMPMIPNVKYEYEIDGDTDLVQFVKKLAGSLKKICNDPETAS